MITDFRLKVFRAVAERLSFTRAADELFITQPAVTKHINELEKQLGVPLFVRRRNAVALPPQGELLLGYVRRLLALYAELNDAFAGTARRSAVNWRSEPVRPFRNTCFRPFCPVSKNVIRKSA